jgi:hypothetical protein
MKETNQTGNPVKKRRNTAGFSRGAGLSAGFAILLGIGCSEIYKHHQKTKAEERAKISSAQLRESIALRNKLQYRPKVASSEDTMKLVNARERLWLFDAHKEGKAAGVLYARDSKSPPTIAVLEELVRAKMKDIDLDHPKDISSYSDRAKKREEYEKRFLEGFKEGFREATTPAF